MHTKLSISIVAALVLSAAAGRVARAQSTSSDQASAPSRSPTNDEINSAETGSPASVDYAKRKISKHKTTNEEIDAAEKGAPASTDYGNREVKSDGNSNAEWRALDKGVPDSVQGEVIEGQSATGSGE
jgi:hypothetical protein